jgi:hypothetical protein
MVQVSPGDFFVAGNYWHFKEKFGIKSIVIHAETVSPQALHRMREEHHGSPFQYTAG